MDGLTLNPQPLTLGSFSLLSNPPVSGVAQVGQICDQCQICNDPGCWDCVDNGNVVPQNKN